MYGGVTVNVIVNETNMSAYNYTEWFVIFNGTDADRTYSDFQFIAGSYMEDLGGDGGVRQKHDISGALPAGFPPGTSVGTMSIYDRFNPQLPGPVVTWNWSSSDAAGADSYHWNQEGIVHIFVNPDGSGFLEYTPNIFSGSTAGGIGQTYMLTWQVDGTGIWTAYSVAGGVDSTGAF